MKNTKPKKEEKVSCKTEVDVKTGVKAKGCKSDVNVEPNPEKTAGVKGCKPEAEILDKGLGASPKPGAETKVGKPGAMNPGKSEAVDSDIDSVALVNTGDGILMKDSRTEGVLNSHTSISMGYAFKLIKRVLPYKRFMIISIILLFFAALQGALFPFIYAYIVEDVIPYRLLSSLAMIVLIFGAIMLVSQVLKLIKSIFVASYSDSLAREIREDFFKLKCDDSCKKKQDSTLFRFNYYVEEMVEFYTDSVFVILGSVFAFLILVPFMFFIEPLFTIISISFLVPILLFFEIMKIIYSGRLKKTVINDEKETKSLFTFMKLSKKRQTPARSGTVLRASRKKIKSGFNSGVTVGVLENFPSLIWSGCIILILFLSYEYIGDGTLSFATLVRFISYQTVFWTIISNFVSVIKRVCSAKAYI